MIALPKNFAQRREAGFTLLECLVVFVLMGAAAMIVTLTLTSAPTFMFRSVSHEAEIRHTQTCLAVLDAAYKDNRSQGDWVGMAAVIAAAQLDECKQVTVKFEGCACTKDGACACRKQWKNEDNSQNEDNSRPDLLVVRLSTPAAEVVRFYAK